MDYVIDASIALGFVLPDEDDDLSGRLLDTLSRDNLCVPWIWHSEVLNGLLQAFRRKRISAAVVDRGIDYFTKLNVRMDVDVPDLQALREVADRYRLTSYDACYLELAVRSHLPLATRDVALKKAAVAHGVSTL